MFLSDHEHFTLKVQPPTVIFFGCFFVSVHIDCQRNIDAVFMLDRSGSVGLPNHLIALQFINTAVSFFNIGRSTSRVGVAAYSFSSNIEFDLNAHSSISSLQNAVGNIVFTGGATNTPDALDDALELLNPATNRGARPSSEGIPKIAILITGDKKKFFLG